MKSIVIAAVAAAALVTAGMANAAGEADAEKAGCLKCHAVDGKKKGPSFKESAAKYKGKSVDDVVAEMMELKSHKKLEVSKDDMKGIVSWILTLK